MNIQKIISATYFRYPFRTYASIPPHYVTPIFKRSEQEQIFETKESDRLKHVPIRPALTNQTSSEFHNELMNLFTNYLMRDGRKDFAQFLISRAFETVKRIQVERYNRAAENEKHKVELDPKVVLEKAIANSTPALHLTKIRKGGINYQVPTPITARKARFIAMNWLIEAGRVKTRETKYYAQLAKELVDASNNEGQVIKKKQELHKQCVANRAYAHFRWIK